VKGGTIIGSVRHEKYQEMLGRVQILFAQMSRNRYISDKKKNKEVCVLDREVRNKDKK